ncbi:MAG: ABC transporter permease, partial [Vicinamibacterales bacterium]
VAWNNGVPVALACGWEVAGRISHNLLFPSASETAMALARLVTTSDFWGALWISNEAFLAGYALALIVGVSSGLALARWKTVDRWLDVYLNLLVVVPKTALMPLFVMALGLGLASRAAVVFMFAFPVIAVTVRAGAREVDARLVGMARTFCATETQIWRSVLTPGSLPSIMTAVRLGLAHAVGGMVTVELLLIAAGIGRLILSFQSDFDAGSLYAAIVVVVTEAVLLIRLAGVFERRFGLWSGTHAIE